MSNETGRAEVYVETFPSRRKQLVSAEGASKCWWREDAKELLYQEPSGRVLAVDVDADVAGVRLVFGEPTLMFEGPPVPADDVRGFFTGPAPFPDGSQFLLIKPAEEAIPAPLTLVVNWTAELETH